MSCKTIMWLVSGLPMFVASADGEFRGQTDHIDNARQRTAVASIPFERLLGIELTVTTTRDGDRTRVGVVRRYSNRKVFNASIRNEGSEVKGDIGTHSGASSRSTQIRRVAQIGFSVLSQRVRIGDRFAVVLRRTRAYKSRSYDYVMCLYPSPDDRLSFPIAVRIHTDGSITDLVVPQRM
jgi:hypothetical protein